MSEVELRTSDIGLWTSDLLTDTHCHLDLEQFASDRDEVVARAREAGVGRIIIPGIDLAGSRRAVELAGRYPEVYAAVGVHPNSAAYFDQDALGELRRLAGGEKVVAVGEIGIDLYWKKVPQAEQDFAFRAQLELAAELGRPVIVHDREAHAQVLSGLKACLPPAGAVLHSFSGDRGLAETALELGCYLGVDGPLTYKKNAELRAIFAAVPLERVLIETDAPYLTPQPRRGMRNEPAFVRYVADKLAEVRGVSLEMIADATTTNAARLFRWE